MEFCYTGRAMTMRQAMLAAAGVAVIGVLSGGGQVQPAATSFIPYSDARPILEAFGEDAPDGLWRKTPEELNAEWPKWVAGRDAAEAAAAGSIQANGVTNC